MTESHKRSPRSDTKVVDDEDLFKMSIRSSRRPTPLVLRPSLSPRLRPGGIAQA